jgi:hypothetical protein
MQENSPSIVIPDSLENTEKQSMMNKDEIISSSLDIGNYPLYCIKFSKIFFCVYVDIDFYQMSKRMVQNHRL